MLSRKVIFFLAPRRSSCAGFRHSNMQNVDACAVRSASVGARAPAVRADVIVGLHVGEPAAVAAKAATEVPFTAQFSAGSPSGLGHRAHNPASLVQIQPPQLVWRRSPVTAERQALSPPSGEPTKIGSTTSRPVGAASSACAIGA